MGNQCIYYTVDDISAMLGVSTGHAYKIIRKLNNQLASQGYIVIAGRVPKLYFKQHYFGMA